MPYPSGDSKKLPDYVKSKKKSIRDKWVAIYNRVFDSDGEEAAFIAANSWLKRQLTKNEPVGRTTAVAIPLELDNTQDLVVRSEGGEEFVSFKLADIYKDQYGLQLPDTVLKEWADKINSGEIEVLGDIDHQEFKDKSIDMMLNPDFDFKKKDGIAKTVKAIFDKGRLWVRAMIDKRYKKQLQKSKGVSMEALVKRHPETNQIVGADLLGFTFGVKDDPAISGTEVYFDD